MVCGFEDDCGLMLVLGVETSCDETGLALVDDQGVVAESLYSQIEIHRKFGGVVPELASRDHVRKTAPLLRQLLADAGVATADIEGVAFTRGPGLVGALLVGAALARSLAFARGIPAVGVHHMEGHLLAPTMEHGMPELPFVALLVSGGHTMLVRVNGLGDYQLLGQTLDDAVGEAFDKTAKAMGLPYPGGPEVARLAETGDPYSLEFPLPMCDRPGMDFSFSGLKTHVLRLLQQHPRRQADIAAGFEQAVADTLAIKCRRAMQDTGATVLMVSGGVGANQVLRQRLLDEGAKRGFDVVFPPPALCTDNGVMIAHAGRLRLLAGQRAPTGISARARWPLTELDSITLAA